MKKVLTILAVLIVLTSAVFAASETHTLRVKADVTEVVPAFQLWLGTTKTNTTPTAFKDGNTHNELATDAKAIDTGWNLDEGGSVEVYAVLANLAKINKIYTLEFTDGVFNVSRSGVALNQTHGPKKITTTAGTEIEGISEIKKETSADNSPVTVAFNGTTVKKTGEDAKLATAVYTYEADTTIDPGVYYANIVLTVSTT